MEYQKIWKKVLNSGEEVRYEFSIGERYRKFEFWVIGGLAILLGLPGFVFLLTGHFSASFSFFFATGLFFGIASLKSQYLKVANAYAFTDHRVLIHRGWLSTNTKSINYDKITEVAVEEPFMSRIFTKTGDMVFHTGNVTDSIVLKNISTPYEVKKKLDSLRSK